MKIADVISAIEEFAPPAYQEDYDNAGLATGDPGTEATGAILCLDVTEKVMEEAVRHGANLIISHHPVLFRPLLTLSDGSVSARLLTAAVLRNLALYSAHTNIDRVSEGVSHLLGKKLGLQNLRMLKPAEGELRKLVVFVPVAHADRIRDALFTAGAGHVGSYDQCSFNIDGTGTFRGSEKSNPFSGQRGILNHEKEVRIETIVPQTRLSGVVSAMLAVHPYEEVAYDIYPIENKYAFAGCGMVGETTAALAETEFLENVKRTVACRCIRHSRLTGRPVRRVAVCGGSGAHLIRDAVTAGAEIYLTGDLKYHDFFEADGKIVLADIGHYESEQFTTELFYEILTKKFPNFAVRFSGINVNPINYF